MTSGLNKTNTTDPSLLPLPLPLPASRDASTEAAGPIKRPAENPQIAYDEPTSTTNVNPISPISIVNTAREYCTPVHRWYDWCPCPLTHLFLTLLSLPSRFP